MVQGLLNFSLQPFLCRIEPFEFTLNSIVFKLEHLGLL